MLQTFFTRKALKGHLHEGHTKGTWALKTFGHSSTWGTRAEEGHLDTEAVKALGYSDTWGLGHSKCTWALRHLRTWDIRGTFYSRLTFLLFVILYRCLLQDDLLCPTLKSLSDFEINASLWNNILLHFEITFSTLSNKLCSISKWLSLSHFEIKGCRSCPA